MGGRSCCGCCAWLLYGLSRVLATGHELRIRYSSATKHRQDAPAVSVRLLLDEVIIPYGAAHKTPTAQGFTPASRALGQ
jgi:hypothetical protein